MRFQKRFVGRFDFQLSKAQMELAGGMCVSGESPTAHDVTPCAVIVDTRNVIGMFKNVLGLPSHRPYAAGIKRALRLYGFEPVEIFAGVATSSSSEKLAPGQKRALSSNQTYCERLTSEGIQVLEGYLAARGDENFQEKGIDVLLALQVADTVERIRKGASNAQVIVVLSEDMDLMPAYDYAVNRGVPLYAASKDIVMHRKHGWLLLHEEALRALADAEAVPAGTAIRRYAARMALGLNASGLPTKWKSRWAQERPGPVTLFNNKGLEGSIRWNRPLSANESIDLHVVGFECDSRRSFPKAILAQKPIAPGRMSGADEAFLTAWTTPTRVRATRGDGEKCTLTVPPGTALQGDQVAVWSSRTKTGMAHHYIGPIESLKVPEEWGPSPVARVTLRRELPSGAWEGHTGTGLTVLVQAEWLTDPQEGHRLTTTVTSRNRNGQLSTLPLTSKLV